MTIRFAQTSRHDPGADAELEDSRWNELLTLGADVLDRVLVLHNGSADALRLGVHWAAFFGGAVSAFVVPPISGQLDRLEDDCVRSIRERTADLLVVASDMRGGLRGPAGLSEHLLSELGVPVLACGAGPAWPSSVLRSVLLPVNGTPGDVSVLRLILPLARATQARVSLLRVVEPAVSGHDQEREPLLRELGQAQVYVDKLAAVCEVAGVAVQTSVRAGSIIPVVGAAARQPDVDLVALSTRARTGSALEIHGSLAGAIARRVPQAVLLVRQG